MPNWVYNYVGVKGDPVDLQAIKDYLNRPFSLEQWEYSPNPTTGKVEPKRVTIQYSNPVFAFWNVIRPSESVMEEYTALQSVTKSSSDPSDPKWLSDYLSKSLESNHWYDWNTTHWGTKWDIAVSDGSQYPATTIYDSDDGTSFDYYFETAWSPVPQVIDILSRKFPTLEFEYEYYEESMWGGYYTWKNGELVEESFHNPPMSHADYESIQSLGRVWFSCDCQNTDDPSQWYADCPIDSDEYELVDGEWRDKNADISTLS